VIEQNSFLHEQRWHSMTCFMLPIEINERTKKKEKRNKRLEKWRNEGIGNKRTQNSEGINEQGMTTEREEYILKCFLRLEMTELNVWQMCWRIKRRFKFLLNYNHNVSSFYTGTQSIASSLESNYWGRSRIFSNCIKPKQSKQILLALFSK